MEIATAGNRPVRIFTKGTGGPLIYAGTQEPDENTPETFPEELDRRTPGKEYCLVEFSVNNWNDDFSPWEAPAVYKGVGFGGRGKETLKWLLADCIPFMESRYGQRKERFLAGYSLAGLFALWAAYEAEGFTGIASCSGSLWYPEWDRYVKGRKLRSGCSIYLSLGSKEEKTKNPVMALVGDRTREQERLLKADPFTESCILEWNQGGHFADPAARLAKGTAWLINNRT